MAWEDGVYHLPSHRYTRRKRTDSIVIHCAMTPAHREVTAAEIRGWHINERGWLDIGYHFHIRRSGLIEVGRPVWAVGAGVAGWNGDSIHICMAGGSDEHGREQNNFTDEQWLSLRTLVITLQEIDEGSERVLGHRDYPNVNKYCPSFDVKSWLKSEGLA